MVIDNIDIQVDYKPIKNTHLAVYPPDGRVHVSAPDYLNDEDIHSYVVSKLDWIIKQRNNIANAPRQTVRQYISGESHYLFGKNYRLNVFDTNSASEVRIIGSEMMMYVHHNASRATILMEFYRERLKETLSEMLAQWTAKLEIDNYSWQVKTMKTQWGSCTKKSRILLFNLELARVPKSCIEYVVVHELTHLVVPNHNKLFEALMSQRLPRWRDRRQQLNDFIASEWKY